MKTSHEQITPLRLQIDEIDRQLLALLNARANLAVQIGEIKQQFQLPLFQPEREQQVIAHLQNINHGPLMALGIEAIWREIMSACRSLESTLTVAYLGPTGTFSEEAALKYFGHGIVGVPCASIDEVFRAVEVGGAQYGMVPIENSSEGAVSRTLDLLLQTSLQINGELSMPIHHHLLGKGLMSDMTVVRAHPQALAQCQNWLNRYCSQPERQAVASNAQAAQMAAVDHHSAAIASEAAAKQYGLQILAHHIHDDPHNRTRFIVIGHTKAKISGKDKTSLILSVPNEAGAVYQLLAPLAQYGVSMCRLESRPARTAEWEYYFYVDINGHQETADVAQALIALQQRAAFYKSLGSYPCSLT